jgi:hypothetical protein
MFETTQKVPGAIKDRILIRLGVNGRMKRKKLDIWAHYTK